jgi:hypothetical protein
MGTDYDDAANRILHALGGHRDPFELARADGCSLIECGGGTVQLVGADLFVPIGVRRERVGFGVLREMARGYLGGDASESAAACLASALLLPREPFERDLGAVGWDLHALKARWPHASHEAIARRIAALEGASVRVIDSGAKKRRYGVAGARGRTVERAVIADREWRRAITIGG